ncbi:hypothetical protein ACIBM3_28320 [Rhodococcus erythropolis]|uniref:hypothetical protein n=1 Tax=Rhodococcus erythropolis TaxID=1833 RepID=UPI00379C7FE0
MAHDIKTSSLHIREVLWTHPDAEALRGAMAAEVGPRCSDRVSAADRAAASSVDPQLVHLTVVAYASGNEGDEPQPVGHATLRWNVADLELKRMYVSPSHRGSGVSTDVHTTPRLNSRRNPHTGVDPPE